MDRGNGKPEALLAWMDALGDPTRLRLLRILEEEELGVAEVCEVLQLPQSTASRHLKVLEDGGWVRHRRQATSHFYRMHGRELPAAARRLWAVSRDQTENWPAARQDGLRLARVLRGRQDTSSAFFASAAGQWDRMREEFYGRSFTRSAMTALLSPELVVADLGCGTGQATAELAGAVRRVIGIDGSAQMLAAARRRCAGLENVTLKKADLGDLPLEDGSVDAAIMVLALSYVRGPAEATAEMARVLKGGGRAVVVDLLPHGSDDFCLRMGQQCMGFDSGDVRRMLEDAGLEQVKVRPLEPEVGAKGPALFLASATRGGVRNPRQRHGSVGVAERVKGARRVADGSPRDGGSAGLEYSGEGR